ELERARRSPQLLGDQLNLAWQDWLAAECRARAVVLVLDDLHWSDLPTVNLVLGALRALADLPLLVLGLARPEGRTRFPALWQASALHDLRLEGLGRSASDRLVRSTLGAQLAPDVVARLVDLAAGNAFYLEELIRHAAGGDDSLPDTIVAMVQARLAAQPEHARRVLRAASVFGPTFPIDGVAALVGDELDLESTLRSLARDEILIAMSDVRGYAFRHALLCEGAAAMLTDDDRRLGHRLAAEWLEIHDSRDAAIIAHHFTQAQQPGRAVPWYRRAAEQALTGNDLAGAIAWATRGLAAGAAREDQAAMLVTLTEAQQWRGDDDVAARQTGERAMALHEPGASGWYRAARELVFVASRAGDGEGIQRLMSAALASEPMDGAAPLKTQMLCIAGTRALNTFGPSPALDALIAQIVADGAASDPVTLGRQCQLRASLAVAGGDFEAAAVLFREAADRFEEGGDLRNAAPSRSAFGFLLCELGDVAQAEPLLRATLALAMRLDARETVAAIRQNLGVALARLGRLVEAAAMQREVIAVCDASGNMRMAALSRVFFAAVELELGDLTAAVDASVRAAEAAREMPAIRCFALALAGRSLVAVGRAVEGLDASREAMAIVREQGGSIYDGESSVRLSLVRALEATGDREAAHDELRAAAALLQTRAANLRDPEARRRFLENIHDNAAIALLSRDWLGVVLS
ncbi:MAG: tetratricopeptide repeat protein, partial [Deltaproteobacteria bacterium]|nr:tetratricopeptide repeat protein [Deltaproteobacteria bacterium]